MNEIDLIVRLAKEMDVFKLMIDVGAHRGGACLPFLKDGWQVYAFEPDRHNRRHLEQVAVSQPRLVVDPRAISNLSRKDVPFYTSKVSDGISGLSRFHESHVETEKVETVTLRDAINTFSIDRVGFLKVDIEGYDLIALRGGSMGEDEAFNNYVRIRRP